MLSWISLKGIAFYQKFISPRKGFRCAYGVLNNTHGCSGAVKAIIKDKGVIAGWQDINNQFSECKAAAATLKKDGESGCKKKRRSCKARIKKESNSCGSVDCCFVPDCEDCCGIDSC